VKKKNIHYCNVLDLDGDERHLWQFTAGRNNVSRSARQKLPAAQPLPQNIVGKNWRGLWQEKLNIAWLPSNQVFLRVLQVPAADTSEVAAMLELQLEKLSPLPPHQIVWSFELAPQSAGAAMQTVIVVIVARDGVEQFLGQLEGAQFQADRLEVPCLHQLLATNFEGDGVWVYPLNSGDKKLALVAWWYGNALQQLQLLHLPDSPAAAEALADQLNKMAWAGEMEGWLTGPAPWHLVADEPALSTWKAPIESWREEPVRQVVPLSSDALAEAAARRAVRGQSNANLLPVEHSLRYRQKFVDGLWMSGLSALLLVYVLGVVVYFGALHFRKYQLTQVQAQVASLRDSYTNAVRLKERIDVLENQLNLKYAALDSWQAVSQLLPADLTLTSLQFSKGQRVTLHGTAPPNQVSQLYDYTESLKNVVVDGQPLFQTVSTPSHNIRPGPAGSQTVAWTFFCDLTRGEKE
jgi:hypothetical protein